MFSFPWWLSLTVGFLSLSVEILWVRLVGFAYDNQPQSFSFVLAAYLIGIAIGAAVGKSYCEKNSNLYFIAAVTLLIAGFFDIFTPLIATSVINMPKNLSLMVALTSLVITSAAIKSVLFPIAHHLGSRQVGPEIGRSVSKIYFGNIIGSTLGPLFTGFWLLDSFTLDKCFILIGSICFVVASACALRISRPATAVAATIAGIVAAAIFWSRGEDDSLLKLAERRTWLSEKKDLDIVRLIQNKHGVIHVLKADSGGDIVLGGNVYDGRINIDAERNSNGLDRIYITWLLRPEPKRILVVGLSSGAWVRVLQSFPGIESIDVVEINPGYIDIIKEYSEVSPLLSDPRIHIHIDDGRRWLKRHPQLLYDLVVQNTSFFWRACITNVLSREYFSEVRSHMNPGAVIATNTTHSYDVYATAQDAFPYAYSYSNFFYASDHPLYLNKTLVTEGLSFLPDTTKTSHSLLGQNKGSVIAKLTTGDFSPTKSLLSAGPGPTAGVITDQNMLSEYRHGRRFGVRILKALLPPEMPTVSENVNGFPASGEVKS